MRLWTIHPKYLDAKGLIALWREGLLALKVLRGKTKGYKHHPQLIRFSATPNPVLYISTYLKAVLDEADHRKYHFNKHKIPNRTGPSGRITETRGQLMYEWKHLLTKLKHRDPARYSQLKDIRKPAPHPMFRIIPGKVRKWEKIAQQKLRPI